MSWLKKAIPPKIKNILGKVKKNIPEGLWQNAHHVKPFYTVLT